MPSQSLGWDGRSAPGRVHLIKDGRQLGQGTFGQHLDHAQGMVRRHALIQVHKTPTSLPAACVAHASRPPHSNMMALPYPPYPTHRKVNPTGVGIFPQSLVSCSGNGVNLVMWQEQAKVVGIANVADRWRNWW